LHEKRSVDAEAHLHQRIFRLEMDVTRAVLRGEANDLIEDHYGVAVDGYWSSACCQRILGHPMDDTTVSTLGDLHREGIPYDNEIAVDLGAKTALVIAQPFWDQELARR
jgi:hypothetical protein